MKIDEKIKNKFLELTQTPLNPADIYSQSICEKCFEQFHESVNFIAQLIVNQETLEKFVYVESSSVEPEEISSQEVEIEDEVSSRLVTEIIYEEHLDPEMEFIESEDLKPRLKGRRASGRTKLCTDCGRTYSTQAYKRHYERVHLRLKNFHVSCTN